LSAAEEIAFLGFTALQSDADFCDARTATLAVADTHQSNVADAWDEVGVDAALCNSTTNTSPTAKFEFTATGLTVQFTDQSTDSDGTVVEWSWDFGNGSSSTVQNPEHTYSTSISYLVTLTVTDDQGTTDSTTLSVQVSELSGFNLSVRGYKVRGIKHADLTWSGANSTDVDVYRDNVDKFTIPNSGSYTDNLNQRGGGSHTYYLCEAGTSTCSNEVTIIY